LLGLCAYFTKEKTTENNSVLMKWDLYILENMCFVFVYLFVKYVYFNQQLYISLLLFYSVVGNGGLTLESVGVQEDSDGGTHSSGGKVLLEFSNDNTVTAVGSGDLAPNASISGVILGGAGLVDVSDSLSVVELSISSIIDTLDLQKDLVGVLSVLSSSEAGEDGLDPESASGGLSGGLSDLSGLLRNFLGVGGHLCVFMKGR